MTGTGDKRGALRIYLGAAPGVGKTFAMLNEGQRRRERGADVVVGVVETHGRRRTAEQIGDLEVVPRRTVDHRGSDAHGDGRRRRSSPGGRSSSSSTSSPTRTRPVRRTRSAGRTSTSCSPPGIDVISTVNIQHLESLNDVVERITGIRQRETIPDHVVRAADQIELVDMAPEALRRRLAHGNVYGAEKIDAALGNYFRPGNLAALRELALLWVADRVDDGLQDYRERHGITRPWETRERVVVALAGAPDTDHLVRRAARIAQRAKGDLIGVHVIADSGLTAGDEPQPDVVAAQRRLLEESRRRVPADHEQRRRRGARRPGPGGERHPDRARRQRPVALARAVRRVGHQPRRAPLRSDRRPRHLPTADRRTRRRATPARRASRSLTPLSPRRQLWGWVLVAASACR